VFRLRGVRPGYRRYKAVALSSDVLDITNARLAVAEGLAQHSHVDAQVPRLDHEVTPNARDELLVTDNLSCVFDQRDEDVERTISQQDCLAILSQRASQG
jgi:hypothetical protein